MKKHKLKLEPYKTNVFNLLKKDNIIVSKNKVYGFSGQSIYNIAKATGLKSKKSRHIIKRFRITVIQMIKDGLEYEKRNMEKLT